MVAWQIGTSLDLKADLSRAGSLSKKAMRKQNFTLDAEANMSKQQPRTGKVIGSFSHLKCMQQVLTGIGNEGMTPDPYKYPFPFLPPRFLG